MSMLTKLGPLLLVAVIVIVAMKMMKGPTISGAEAKALVDKGAKLVDVRTSGEFQSGHIDGALNIPLGELSKRMDELGDKSAPIVVHCASGVRSGKAKRQLQDAGFKDVSNMGGIGAWPN